MPPAFDRLASRLEPDLPEGISMIQPNHQTAPTQFVETNDIRSPIAVSARPAACRSSSCSTFGAEWITGIPRVTDGFEVGFALGSSPPAGVVTLSKRRREADCCAKLQTAAATSRHVVIAARSTQCVWADMRWRWTLKMS
jgi:hypothetical protein